MTPVALHQTNSPIEVEEQEEATDLGWTDLTPGNESRKRGKSGHEEEGAESREGLVSVCRIGYAALRVTHAITAPVGITEGASSPDKETEIATICGQRIRNAKAPDGQRRSKEAQWRRTS